MTTEKNGGPAFQHDNQELGNMHRNAQPGMSLRDWFAGQALAGFTAGSFWSEVDNSEAAEAAYRVADAMLAEREK